MPSAKSKEWQCALLRCTPGFIFTGVFSGISAIFPKIIHTYAAATYFYFSFVPFSPSDHKSQPSRNFVMASPAPSSSAPSAVSGSAPHLSPECVFSLLEPVIEKLDSQIRAARGSQILLRDQVRFPFRRFIRSMSSFTSFPIRTSSSQEELLCFRSRRWPNSCTKCQVDRQGRPTTWLSTPGNSPIVVVAQQTWAIFSTEFTTGTLHLSSMSCRLLGHPNVFRLSKLQREMAREIYRKKTAIEGRPPTPPDH